MCSRIKVSRSGLNPEPTVIVRMIENKFSSFQETRAIFHADVPLNYLSFSLRLKLSIARLERDTRMSETGKTILAPSFNAVRIAFIQACWHKDIVEQSRISFTRCVAEYGISGQNIDTFDVPGSLEIPLQCQVLANTGNYDLIVAAGLIVDGGIYRHDFVAGTVLEGMMRVQLDTGVPILSVVLTPHHFNEQAAQHQFFYDHFLVKGEEAANACLQVLSNQQLNKQLPAEAAA